MILFCSLAAGATIVMPFTQLSTGQVVVSGTIGTAASQFIVDTGASVTVVRPELWAAAGNQPPTGMAVGGDGAGGSIGSAHLVMKPDVSLGGQPMNLQYAVVMAMEATADMPAIGGVVGMDVLGNYIAEFDFSNHQIHLYDHDDPTELPTTWTPTKRLPGGLLQVALAVGRGSVPAVVDLGASGTILNATAAGLPGVTGRNDCGARAFGADAHELTLGCAVAEHMAVGTIDFGEQSVAVGDLPVFVTLHMVKPSGKPAAAAVLGVDLLGQKRFFVDAKHKRIGWIWD